MAIVNFESVAAAAEALQAAGQRASVRAVIAALGGGSPNSVLKLLAEWKAGRPVVRIADTELDPRITDAIKGQMQRVGEQAAQAAEERAAAIDEDLQALSEAQAKAEQQIAALTTERDTAQAQASHFDEQLKEARAQAERDQEQSAQALATLRQELAAERQRFEAAAAELARAQVRLEALPALQADIEQLRATLRADAEHSARALASCQQARQLAEQGAAVLGARLEAAERRATEADARTAKADARADALAHDLAGLNVALQASQGRLEAAAREVGAADAAARKAAEELAEFRRRAADAAKPAKQEKGRGEQGALKL
jgi:colicin import membrane protein